MIFFSLFFLIQTHASLFDLPEFKKYPIRIHDPMQCIEKLTTKEERYFKLGSGISGGIVYRVRSNSTVSKVQKVYKDHAAYKNDVAAFEVIEKAILYAPRTEKPFELRTLKALSESQSPKMILEDVYGETAANYLLRLPHELHHHFIQWYESVIERVVKGLNKIRQSNQTLFHFLDEDEASAGTLAHQLTARLVRISDQMPIEIWIHMDNVIIDSQGNLVIIDPH